jgi:hypothetical protein
MVPVTGIITTTTTNMVMVTVWVMAEDWVAVAAEDEIEVVDLVPADFVSVPNAEKKFNISKVPNVPN